MVLRIQVLSSSIILFFQAEDGIRDHCVTGVQTCALPIYPTATETDPEAQSAEDGVWTRGPNGELVPDYDATFPIINEGEVVRGTVVRVDKDEVLVDIGYKSEGVIPVGELSIRRSVNPADEVHVDEE